MATKVAVIVVVIGAAIIFFFRGGAEEEAQLDTPESATTYICLDDGHVFKLTPAAWEKLSKDGGIKTPNEDSRIGLTLVRCPTTKEYSAVRAAQCPNDQTWFPERMKDFTPGKCPKCGFAFYER